MSEIRNNIAKSFAYLIVSIVSYVIVAALLNNVIIPLINEKLPGSNIQAYQPYINILLALAFGYWIISSFSNVIYWNLRIKYEHASSAAVRNVFRMIGIGALVSSIAGAIAGGAAGVALGGFIGIVIGFASQQVIGQILSGLFLLLSRPFKIGDRVVLLGDEGIVEDVSSLFTIVKKEEGTKVMIPNNSVLGNKIYVKSK